MNVKPLSLGPIVGWTQDTSVRLWGRGAPSKKIERCFGVARLRKSGSRRFSKPSSCKMRAIFDYTGLIDFKSLEPGAEYEFQFGYLNFDGEHDEFDALTGLTWARASRGTFRTEPVEEVTASEFVFGSCRYLLKLLGANIFDRRGDKTFRSIREQIAEGIQTDFMLMVGDQIYADDLNRIFPDQTLSEFFERYRDVFGQEHIRKLMAQLPTYMILDDHEIRDNWSNDDRAAHAHLYAAAMHAYQSYQMVHGPAFRTNIGDNRSLVPNKLWYDFVSGSSAFFVMDTRTERTSKTVSPQMISFNQMEALKTWLLSPENSTRTKFIVSSVPVFPDSYRFNEDKWQGFNEQRVELLDFIRERQIRQVVFLSGDIHCTLSAQLHCSTDEEFVVTSIVSSSLFWPYPQGQASSYKLHGTLAESQGTIYTVENPGPVFSEDNFTRIRAESGQLDVSVFDRKGERLHDEPIVFSI